MLIGSIQRHCRIAHGRTGTLNRSLAIKLAERILVSTNGIYGISSLEVEGSIPP